MSYKDLIGKWTFHHDIGPEYSYVYKITDFLQLANVNSKEVYDTEKEARVAMINEIKKRLTNINSWLDMENRK